VSLLSSENGETREEMFCPVKPGTNESECSSANNESIAKQYRMVEQAMLKTVKANIASVYHINENRKTSYWLT
jgi:hypothetical protein